MVGIQNVNRVQHPDLPILRNAARELVEKIAGVSETRFVFERLLALGNSPAIAHQRGDACQQPDRFSDVRVVRMIVQVGIERREHGNARAQHVHRMGVLRHEPQHLQNRLGQFPFGRERLRKFRQLTGGREFALQK